jgi:hypothetical protein
VAKANRTRDAMRRLAAAEDRFLQREFLAPIVRGREVRVRIEGVICRLRTQPPDFEGWGVFRPVSHDAARLVRAANLTERRRYLELLPLVRLILCRRVDEQWRAIPAHSGDSRFEIDGLVSVCHVESGQLFDLIRTRFDGTCFWFEGPEPRSDAAAAAYLRQAIEKMVEPKELKRKGLTAEQRMAYAQNFWPRRKAELEAQRDRTEERLRAALAHAGADFVDYLERRDGYRVTYVVDGERHVSSVAKRDLTIQSAGICLEGTDRHFDLQSLVGVLREGRRASELQGE